MTCHTWNKYWKKKKKGKTSTREREKDSTLHSSPIGLYMPGKAQNLTLRIHYSLINSSPFPKTPNKPITGSAMEDNHVLQNINKLLWGQSQDKKKTHRKNKISIAISGLCRLMSSAEPDKNSTARIINTGKNNISSVPPTSSRFTWHGKTVSTTTEGWDAEERKTTIMLVFKPTTMAVGLHERILK